MANSPRGSYLLPENPNPEEDGCLLVFYPDDPAFRRALIGSLMHLEKWVAYERDEAHTALIAANRFKQSNQRTLATLEILDCELLSELAEDEMSITVNNNVSCGQCGGSGCSCEPNITPDPTQTPPEVTNEIPNLPTQEDDGVNPPDGFEDRATYLAHKCRAARELTRDIIQTLGNFGSFSGVLSALGAYAFGILITAQGSALVVSALLPLVALGLSTAVATAIVGSALLILIAGGVGLMAYFNTLQASLAGKADEMTCLLYAANSGAEARAAIIQFINEDVAELVFDDAGDKEVFSRSIETILGAILAPKIFTILFATGTVITEWLSERDDGFDCSECDDPLLGAWEWTYSSGYSGESIVTVTLNNPTDFHANGEIHRSSQFGAYEFRITLPLDPSVTRVEFNFTKGSGDGVRIRMAGVNIFSNAQTGSYMIAETVQGDAGNFDFTAVNNIPSEMVWDFSVAYSNSAPRPFDWAIDDFLATV